MNLDEETLKAMASADPIQSNQEKALKTVLNKSARTTAVKDVGSMFVGWLWVIFLGFGASMYSAKRKLELHKKPHRKFTQTHELKHKSGAK